MRRSHAGDTGHMRSPLAVSVSAIILVSVAALSVIVLALIIVAPWKRVRDEPPLDKDVETRLLLRRRDPEEATGEVPTTQVADLSDRLDPGGLDPGGLDPGGLDPGGSEVDFAELRDLGTTDRDD